MEKGVWVVQHNIPLDALKSLMEAQPIEKGAISSRDRFITCSTHKNWRQHESDAN